MDASCSEDPGGSQRRTIPLYMDPTNRFGELTFLQLVGENDSALPNNPFLIAKSVENVAGGAIESAKSEAKGSRYTLMVRNPKQVERLLKMDQLCDGTAVKIQTHPTLNTCRCVVSCFDLIKLEENDILAEIRDQGVIRVQRITRNENGTRVNTAALILTFGKSVYPSNVKLGLLNVRTRPYFPNPMLCYGCFEYGHTKARCERPQRCSNCSENYHNEECDRKTYCRNCKGDHRPSSRLCPLYKEETEIIKVKVRDNITFTEARKRFAEQQKCRNYAEAAAQQTSDQRIEELLQIIKQKDTQIANLLEASKRMEEKMDSMASFMKKQDQRIQSFVEMPQLKPTRPHPGVETRSRNTSPIVPEGKRTRPLQNHRSPVNTSSSSKSNAIEPIVTRSRKIDNLSPPPKRTAGVVYAADDEESERCESPS